MNAPLLRWNNVEAVCSWCYANGKAGEYRITWSFGEPGQTLTLPNGSSCICPTRDAAKETAEGFEAAFIADMKPSTEKFWMVYGLGTGNPTYRHFSRKSAVTEAQRLARNCTDTTFVVLEVVDAFKAEQPIVNKIEIAAPREDRDGEDDIPF